MRRTFTILLTLGWSFGVGMTLSPPQSLLEELLVAAIQSPEEFGFPSSQAAKNAYTARAYPLYTLQEWLSIKDPQTPHPVQRLLLEVVYNQDGIEQIACCLILARKNGRWEPALLGMNHWVQELQRLRQIPEDWGPVLVADLEKKELFLASSHSPGIIPKSPHQ